MGSLLSTSVALSEVYVIPCWLHLQVSRSLLRVYLLPLIDVNKVKKEALQRVQKKRQTVAGMSTLQ